MCLYLNVNENIGDDCMPPCILAILQYLNMCSFAVNIAKIYYGF